MHHYFPTAALELLPRGGGSFQPGDFQMTSLKLDKKQRYLVTLPSQCQNFLPKSKSVRHATCKLQSSVKFEKHDRLSLFNSSLNMLSERLTRIGNKDIETQSEDGLSRDRDRFQLKKTQFRWASVRTCSEVQSTGR